LPRRDDIYHKLLFKGEKRLTVQNTIKKHNAMALFMLSSR